MQVPMRLPFAPAQTWKVTFGWGQNTHVDSVHHCWDFDRVDGETRGAVLYSCAPGRVVKVRGEAGSQENVLGNFVDVEHAPREVASLNHVLQNSPRVATGALVERGEELAETGDTGASWDTETNKPKFGNDHVHFTVGSSETGGPGQTIPSEFTNYSVSTDEGKTWTHVDAGVPRQGDWVRQSLWWPGDSEWSNLGGSIEGAPAVVTAWGPGHIDLIARFADGSVRNKAWNQSPGGWWPGQRAWANLGGSTKHSPSVVSWGRGRLDVFVVGSDVHVYNKVWDENREGDDKWWPSHTDWQDLGGSAGGTPVAFAWAPGHIDLFIVGIDGHVYNKVWDQDHAGDDKWWPSRTDWQDLGGSATGSPAAYAWAPGHIDLFIVGTDGHVYNKVWDQNREGDDKWWPSRTDWQDLGGSATGSPAAVGWGGERIDLFVRFSDGTVRSKSWDPSTGWWPSKSDWFDLGGDVSASPVAVAWAKGHLDVFARFADGTARFKDWSHPSM